MSAEINVAIRHTVQRLSGLKYFSKKMAIIALDTTLEIHGTLLTPKDRKQILKKFVRTLERLGYLNHRGGVQTVGIVRSL